MCPQFSPICDSFSLLFFKTLTVWKRTLREVSPHDKWELGDSFQASCPWGTADSKPYVVSQNSLWGLGFWLPTVIICGHSALAVFPTFLLVSLETTSQINSMHSSPSLRIYCFEEDGVPPKGIPSFLEFRFNSVPCVHVIHRRGLSWSESCTPSQRAYNQTNRGCLTRGRFWRGGQGVFKCLEGAL